MAEAWTAIDAGVSALGLVTAMPSGAGIISDDLAAEIAGCVPPGVDTFLLTSRRAADDILEQHGRVRTTTLQFVDRIEHSELRRLRAKLPGIRLVQAVHVTDERAIGEALALQGLVDAVLLDSGTPQSTVKVLGGTGRRHDWGISARIRALLDIPIFLAGGLSPENAAQAVIDVGPYGLDVCSNLRVKGALDGDLLEAFMWAARSKAHHRSR
jgi:phosphoribosylanthranilate isomerase